MSVRILLADDHAIMRQGLRQILSQHPGFEVVAEASSGLEAVEMAERLKPDLAIMDIAMKELNGIEATSQILRRSPLTSVLILSMHSDERYVVRAVKAGARGYVLKDSAGDELVEAIRSLERGSVFFSPEVSKVLQGGYARIKDPDQMEDRYELLTERERQIYQLLAEGNSNKEIANRLNLSLHTVETHRARVMEKLDIHSAADLVLSAVRRGLVN
jgi:DNA-binding NarL/FixJ family response regulator